MVGTLKNPAHRVLLVGGGHAHIAALRALRQRPDTGLQITLVSRQVHTIYSGALPGYVAGHWPLKDTLIDVRALCSETGTHFLELDVTALDAAKKTVTCNDGSSLTFDTACIDVGTRTKDVGVAGSAGRAVSPIKPFGEFIPAWESFLERVRSGTSEGNVLILGAGLAGIELAAAIRHRLDAFPRSLKSHVTIADSAGSTSPRSSSALRTALHRALQKRRIDIMTSARLTDWDGTIARIEDGRALSCDFILNCAGTEPYEWISASGLSNKHGYIPVDIYLRHTDQPDIWAAGDAAQLPGDGSYRNGVHALRAGQVLAENLRRRSTGRHPAAYHPQSDYLKLVSLGDRSAVGEKWGLVMEGVILWHLKKWIDSGFLRG